MNGIMSLQNPTSDAADKDPQAHFISVDRANHGP